MYLTENFLTLWAKSEGGLCLTRTVWNNDEINFESTPPNLVILTGYIKVLSYFFSKIYPRLHRPFVLVIIESDYVPLQKQWLDLSMVKRVFSWNPPFVHSKLSAIPIGLNFDRHYYPLTSWLFSRKEPVFRNRLVCSNFNFDNGLERQRLRNVILNDMKGYCDVLPFRPPLARFSRKSFVDGDLFCDVTDPKCYDDWSSYKFILSPFGAGIDCHRTWEALILGVIPIVKTSLLDPLFENLPVLIIEDWGELSARFLETQFERLDPSKNHFDTNKLTLSWWTDHIGECVQP
ncbi:MAG: hypothetical protein EB069_09035 [Actinobacteria bacterium]|nr:hypothetical protein [Actinomycetota bacterium]